MHPSLLLHSVSIIRKEARRLLRIVPAPVPYFLFSPLKDCGLKVTAACSGYSPSFTEASTAVSPHARLQADHFPTVKHLWGHRNKALFAYRRQVKASGEAQQDDVCLALAKKLWTRRWSLLKKPGNLSAEEKQAIAERESEDEGFVHRFRTSIRHLVNVVDHAHSETQARLRRQPLRKDLRAVDDDHREKSLTFFDDLWDQALR